MFFSSPCMCVCYLLIGQLLIRMAFSFSRLVIKELSQLRFSWNHLGNKSKVNTVAVCLLFCNILFRSSLHSDHIWCRNCSAFPSWFQSSSLSLFGLLSCVQKPNPHQPWTYAQLQAAWTACADRNGPARHRWYQHNGWVSVEQQPSEQLDFKRFEHQSKTVRSVSLVRLWQLWSSALVQRLVGRCVTKACPSIGRTFADALLST